MPTGATTSRLIEKNAGSRPKRRAAAALLPILLRQTPLQWGRKQAAAAAASAGGAAASMARSTAAGAGALPNVSKSVNVRAPPTERSRAAQSGPWCSLTEVLSKTRLVTAAHFKTLKICRGMAKPKLCRVALAAVLKDATTSSLAAAPAAPHNIPTCRHPKYNARSPLDCRRARLKAETRCRTHACRRQ